MNKLAYSALLIAFMAVLTFQYTDFSNPAENIGGDEAHYRQMAIDGPQLIPKDDWGYRPLMPAMAWAMSKAGMNLDVAFFCLTFMSLCFGFMLMANMFGRLAGILYLSTFWVTFFYMNHFWMLDPMAHALILAGLWAIGKEKHWLAALIVLVGMFCKEHVWLVLIFHLHYYWKDKLRILPLYVLPFVLFMWIRLYCGSPGGVYSWETVDAAVNFYSSLHALWHTFGLIWIPFAVWLIRSRNIGLIALLAIMFIPLRMMTGDVHRVIVTLFFIPVIGEASRQLELLVTKKYGDYVVATFVIMHILMQGGIKLWG